MIAEAYREIASRVALRFGAMVGLRSRLLVSQAIECYESEKETGHGVDWVLADDEPLETILRTLVRTKPDSLAVDPLIGEGEVDFQLVVDVTAQPDAHLETGPFLVGKILCGRVDVDVRARLIDHKELAGRRLFIYAGEINP